MVELDLRSLAPEIGELLHDARRDFKRMEPEMRDSVRESRIAGYRGLRKVQGVDSRLAFSLRSGEVLTGDTAPEVVHTDLHDELNRQIDAPPQFVRVQGYGSVFDVGYVMHDMFGPYVETMERGAFDSSLELGSSLRVQFLNSHQGLGLASSESRRMAIGTDDIGLGFVAALNPAESDAMDVISKLASGSSSRDTSVGGSIREVEWNDDYDHVRIKDWWMSRGEISAVHAGANPAGFVVLRDESLKVKLAAVDVGQQRKLRRLSYA